MTYNIHIVSKRTKIANIRKKFGSVAIVDTSSKAPGDYQRFSPFYPHGGIPVPGSPGFFSMSVEGLWQGLKVFDNVGVDYNSLMNTSMRGLKRTVRKFGPCRGHARSLGSPEPLLGYLEARKTIYLPAYKWVLENKLSTEITELRGLCRSRTLVLLDYETNEDIEDLSKPLSHAGLVKKFLLGELTSE